MLRCLPIIALILITVPAWANEINSFVVVGTVTAVHCSEVAEPPADPELESCAVKLAAAQARTLVVCAGGRLAEASCTRAVAWSVWPGRSWRMSPPPAVAADRRPTAGAPRRRPRCRSRC